jgi:hypothetical protein
MNRTFKDFDSVGLHFLLIKGVLFALLSPLPRIYSASMSHYIITLASTPVSVVMFKVYPVHYVASLFPG